MTEPFNTKEVYEKALLSKLAYENIYKDYDLNQLKNITKDGERVFSDYEVDYLKNNFVVLDATNASYSFRACWVEKIDKNGNETGDIIYCIAGTDKYSLGDIVSDVQIGRNGIAVISLLKHIIITYE